ncbi:transmembrane protein 241-like isoform X5 [Sceloporus undulatus]|nr:transmembrane protein 241-like isoform X5 [Sceloporus undulatus]XP_042299326.1 transmembrane protein 241-like isoform X5 [Sceloporus undulatus]
MLILLVAAGCLPLYDPQFDTDGYFWAFMHVLSVGAYKVYHKSWTPSSLSISEQQYINYAFSMVMLAFASHPTGDLFSALEFPFLYFYRFHSSCFASGVLGFFLTFHTMKLKNNTSTGQYAAWSFLAKVITAGLSPLFFEITMNVPTACCLLLGGFAEVLLLYIERTGT